jgi:hypothetical protein
VVECGPCPIFASFTLAFTLQLRKKHGETLVRVRKTSVRLRKTSVTVQNLSHSNQTSSVEFLTVPLLISRCVKKDEKDAGNKGNRHE